MAYGLDPIADFPRAPLERYQAGLGEYLDAVGDDAWSTTTLPSLRRWAERLEADYGPVGGMLRAAGLGPMATRIENWLQDEGADPRLFQPKASLLPKEEVQRRGKELGLNLDRAMSPDAFDSIADERRRRLANDLVFSRAREMDGYGPGRAALSVLMELATMAADPFNIASAFLPVSRAPLVAARLAAIRQPGLQRLAAGGIEGAVGNLAVEPFVALAAVDEDPHYGPVNWLLTAAFGAALGGGLHYLGGRFTGREATPRRAVEIATEGPLDATQPAPQRVSPAGAVEVSPTPRGDAVAPPEAFPVRAVNDDLAATVPQDGARLIDQASPETRDAAMSSATASLLRDRRPDVAWLFDGDARYVAAKAAYAEQTRFREEMRVSVEAMRAEAEHQRAEIARLKAQDLTFKPPEDFKPSKGALAEAKGVKAGRMPGKAVAEPESLSQFIRRNGGLNMDTPEASNLRAQDIGPLSGLLRKRRLGGVTDMQGGKQQIGHGFDDMATMAREAGFYHGDTPDLARFIQDVIEDANGSRKTYADLDAQARWTEYQEARASFDQYVDQLGIDPARYDDRTLAYILSLDPARQRVKALEEAFAEGRLSEADAEAVAIRLEAEMAEAQAAAIAEAREEFTVAFHGSPYTFDRFDMAKVGTGEGAQMYGHGLYFAEEKQTAEGYRATLANFRNPPPPPKTRAEKYARRKLLGSTVEDAISSVEFDIATSPRTRAGKPPEMMTEALRLLKEGEVKPAGSLYEVSIRGSKERFIDWDKPISGQSDHVRAAIRRFVEREQGLRPPPDNMKAADWLDTVQNFFQDSSAVSRAFAEEGIAGVRYLDQGSRDAGEGTRNIVVFDDKLVSITSRDGVPVRDEEAYNGLTREEFDALDNQLRDLEARAGHPLEHAEGPEAARLGEGRFVRGADDQFEPAALAEFLPEGLRGRVADARFRTETRISADTIEQFARRQGDPANDLHADLDAAARATAEVEARGNADVAAELAEVEALARPLLTEADQEAIKLKAAALKEEKAMTEAYAACKMGGGDG